MSRGKRWVKSLSFSPSNPDAVLVAKALAERATSRGQLSPLVLRWAAEYLRGRAGGQAEMIDELGMTEDELSAALDAF